MANVHDIPTLISSHGILVVFAAVLIEGVGVPVPSYTVVILAASILYTSHLGLVAVFFAAFTAALIVDLAWYWAGLRLGYRLLRTLCRMSLSTDSCVQRTEALFLRWGLSSLLVARFLPGYSVIAQPLAGALRQPFASFLFYDLIGLLIWCLFGIVLGAAFSSAVEDILNYLDHFGMYGTLVLLAAVLAYAAFRWYRRWAFVKRLRMDRITVSELRNLILDGRHPVILDVRPDAARAREGVIPGSLHVSPSAIESLDKGILASREIVVYCACPNEASAATIAQRLVAKGVRRVRPLLGGIDAWIEEGFEVDVFSESPSQQSRLPSFDSASR